MTFNSLVFFVTAAFILITALLSVTERKIFRSAIYLLFCMMGIAGLYFWLNYEFIAAVQIVVYVGGIVVLIIFSIFLTQQVGIEMSAPEKWRALFALLAALLGFVFCGSIIVQAEIPVPKAIAQELTANQIGQQLLSLTDHGYILPFEVVSMLLLAAMVGCIVIALKQPVVAKALSNTKQPA